MTPDEHRFDRQRLFYGILFVLLVGGAALIYVGIGRKPENDPSKQTASDPSQEALTSAREALDKGADVSACRSAVQNLNLYLARNAEDRPQPLSEQDQRALRRLLHLNRDELAEICSPTFTALDAHYLDGCLLMRDAAHALDLADLAPQEQAEQAFAWVTRQVRLVERQGDLTPPQLVLRRGWGTAAERSLVFLALLQQLGIEGCTVACPKGQHRIAGALVGNDILLFDSGLGLPLPGKDGKGIATLAELRSQPELLRPLTVDSKYPYDVKPEQVKSAEVDLVCSLSATAPRMKYLEAMLAAPNPIKLATDSAAMLEKFQQAAGKAGVQVRFWNRSVDPHPATDVLRRFLAPEEGGIDPSHRLERLEGELFPWQALPEQVRSLPPDVPPGLWLKFYFAELFEDVPLSPQKVAEWVNQQLRSDDLLQDISIRPDELANDRHKQFVYFFLTGEALQAHASHPFVHFLLAAGSPRDDMLRGRPGEATTKLVETLDQVRFQQEPTPNDANLEKQMAAWSDQAKDAQAEFQRAEHAAARQQSSNSADALEEARARMLSTWPLLPAKALRFTEKPIPLPPWLVLLMRATAEPLGAEAMYLLALGKQEEAEGRQLRVDHSQGNALPAEQKAAHDAWRAAADWWKTYLEEYPHAAGAAAARAWRARALEQLGERQAAAALLKDLSGNLSPLEKTGRLYWARQLAP